MVAKAVTEVVAVQNIGLVGVPNVEEVKGLVAAVIADVLSSSRPDLIIADAGLANSHIQKTIGRGQLVCRPRP